MKREERIRIIKLRLKELNKAMLHAAGEGDDRAYEKLLDRFDSWEEKLAIAETS